MTTATVPYSGDFDTSGVIVKENTGWGRFCKSVSSVAKTLSRSAQDISHKVTRAASDVTSHSLDTISHAVAEPGEAFDTLCDGVRSAGNRIKNAVKGLPGYLKYNWDSVAIGAGAGMGARVLAETAMGGTGILVGASAGASAGVARELYQEIQRIRAEREEQRPKGVVGWLRALFTRESTARYAKKAALGAVTGAAGFTAIDWLTGNAADAVSAASADEAEKLKSVLASADTVKGVDTPKPDLSQDKIFYGMGGDADLGAVDPESLDGMPSVTEAELTGETIVSEQVNALLVESNDINSEPLSMLDTLQEMGVYDGIEPSSDSLVAVPVPDAPAPLVQLSALPANDVPEVQDASAAVPLPEDSQPVSVAEVAAPVEDPEVQSVDVVAAEPEAETEVEAEAVPELEPEPEPEPEPELSEVVPEEYIVQAGDNLTEIVEEQYAEYGYTGAQIWALVLEIEALMQETVDPDFDKNSIDVGDRILLPGHEPVDVPSMSLPPETVDAEEPAAPVSDMPLPPVRPDLPAPALEQVSEIPLPPVRPSIDTPTVSEPVIESEEDVIAGLDTTPVIVPSDIEMIEPYTIQGGDNLSQIIEDHYPDLTAEELDAMMYDIAYYNGLQDPGLIYPGDVINFPAPGEEVEIAPGFFDNAIMAPGWAPGQTSVTSSAVQELSRLQPDVAHDVACVVTDAARDNVACTASRVMPGQRVYISDPFNRIVEGVGSDYVVEVTGQDWDIGALLNSLGEGVDEFFANQSQPALVN